MNNPIYVVVVPSRDNLELKLKPLAVIQCTVLDAGGLPIRGVGIQALQSSIIRRRRQFHSLAPALPGERETA